MTSGHWIDVVIVLLFAIAIWRGFRRGIIREIFSLFGVLIAVAIAFDRYHALAKLLMDDYPLLDWQAQLIAFLALSLGISLLAMLIGFLWSKIVKFTPFAFVDSLAGAIFGFGKVFILVLAIVIIFNSVGVPNLDQALSGSQMVNQIEIMWPHLRQMMETVWPQNWSQPSWLFPPIDLKEVASI